MRVTVAKNSQRHRHVAKDAADPTCQLQYGSDAVVHASRWIGRAGGLNKAHASVPIRRPVMATSFDWCYRFADRQGPCRGASTSVSSVAADASRGGGGVGRLATQERWAGRVSDLWVNPSPHTRRRSRLQDHSRQVEHCIIRDIFVRLS
jgi:hypothetical protein